MTHKRFYPRAEPAAVADQLLALAETLREMGWFERGGHLIRDPSSGEVIDRTKWVPHAEWWRDRPYWFNEQQVAGIVQKHLLRAEPLTELEAKCYKHLVEDVARLTAQQAPPADEPSWLTEESPA